MTNKIWTIKKYILSIATFLMLMASNAYSASDNKLLVIYPKDKNEGLINRNYITTVLHLALNKSGNASSILPSERILYSDLSKIEALNKREITVMWTGENPALSNDALAIKFPIYRGLLGYRSIIANRENSKFVCNAKNIRDLEGFIFGLGHGWSDVSIFQDNDLSIIQANKSSLYKLTSTGDIEILIRSIFESRLIEKEILENHENLTECEGLYIHYSHHLYFYVNKNNKDLYNAINTGLEIALNDGSFDRIFNKALNQSGILNDLSSKDKIVIELKDDFNKESDLDFIFDG